MKRYELFFSLLLVFLLISTGCAVKRTSGGLVSGNYGNPAIWLRSAAEHEQNGDLQRALFDLRVARTVSKRDANIDKDIERLNNKIAVETKKRMNQGSKAVQQGKFAKARRNYLEVLSLDPKHKAALTAMRKLDERASKLSMEKKVALSINNGNNRRKSVKLAEGFQEEAYSYSRQAILQTDEKSVNTQDYIKEIETYLKRFSRDSEVRDLLIKTYLQQAEIAFQKENYSDTLSYLERAEQALDSEKKNLKAIQKQRKAYSKELYVKGVRSSRKEPMQAIKYWEYALKFDPNDKKTLLRLRNTETTM